MRRLIISEKNLAARRIALILSNNTHKSKSVDGVQTFTFSRDGDEYTVLGLRGHIIELDYPDEYQKDWDAISPKDLVYVKPVKKVEPSARKIMSALKKLADASDEIVVATDFDREGELIGAEALAEANVSRAVRRARFSALTKAEIERAFAELAELDHKLAASAETRQLIDLAWGAALTRFISLASGQLGKDFLSVGRVQSPTLALIVDREREIKQFVPTPYWEVRADLRKGDAFNASHKHGRFYDKEEAHRAVSKAKLAKTATVVSVVETENNEYPPIPFNTTTFLMEANKLGLSASQAMKIAEDLYTAGYISYPRTDNTVYPPSLGLRYILEKLRGSEFAKEVEEILAQESLRPSRGKKSTTDHPPIHPVEAATKADLKGNSWAVYELVTRRFLATLAPACVSRTTKVDIDIGGEPFESEGYNIVSPGWRRYYPYYRAKEVTLPRLAQGDPAEVLRVHSGERKTSPPERYTQGSLVKKMEELGLGTKSTRHETIQKLYDRRFVKGTRSIQPTESGIAVIEALEQHAKDITNAKMTAHLESDMDMIANGELEQAEVVEESQAMLDDIMEVLEKHKKEVGEAIRKALREQHTLGQCPACKTGQLMQIRSKNGPFAGCSNFPQCKNTYPLPHGMLVLATGETCPVCGAPRVRMVARGQAPTTVCIDPRCPSAIKERHLGKCPSCGKDIRVVQSRKGKRFAGCSGYPECKVMYPLPQQGRIVATGTTCETCGAPMVSVVKQNRGRWTLCLNIDCPSKTKKLRPGESKGNGAEKAPAEKRAEQQ